MLTYLMKGGPLLIAIGICSIAAGTYCVLQWLRIREANQPRSKWISDLLGAVTKRDWSAATRIAGQSRHPFAQPWSVAFQLLADGRSDFRDIEETVSVEGSEVVSRLEVHLKPIATITTILPMLGFLGTILGLIVSFQNWEQMGAQVSIGALAGGIYQAMITTAAGLMTAIPYYILHHYFSARVQNLSLQLSKETTLLFRWTKEALLADFSSERAASVRETHAFSREI